MTVAHTAELVSANEIWNMHTSCLDAPTREVDKVVADCKPDDTAYSAYDGAGPKEA